MSSRNLESASGRFFESAADRDLESGPISGGGGLPVSETWTGSNGTPWADPPWDVTNVLGIYGAVVTNTIQGNRGRLTCANAHYAFAFATHDDSTHTDVDITYVYAVSDLSEKYVETFWRMGATVTLPGDPDPIPGWPGHCYSLDIQPNIDQVNLGLIDGSGTATTPVAVNSAGVNVTSDLHVRILAVGTRHRVKWWAGTEPGTWQIDYTDVANTYTSGKFAFGLYNGDNNDTEQVEYDNLSITVPAAATTLSKGVGAIRETNTATDLVTLNTSWYYDWASYSTVGGSFPPVPSTPGIQYVPMMWGDWILDPRWGTATGDGTLGGDPASSIGSSNILLGFNEPNITAQANMTVARALALWPQLEATGARLGSPAMSPNSDGITWLDAFFAASPRCEFLCVHWYPEWNGGYANVGDYLDYLHTRYGLPIWLTEVATTTGTVADNAALMPAVMAACVARSWVERVAWFCLTRSASGGDGFPNTVLVNTDGSLNAAGTVYAGYPPGPLAGGPVPLGGAAAGTSSAAATMAVTKALVGSSGGTSTATSPLSVNRGLVAVPSAGTSTATSPLGVNRALVAVASAGTSTAAGPLGVTRSLGGSSVGASAATGASISALALAGSSAGSSTASGTLVGSSIQALAGNSDGASTVSATPLIVIRGLVGSSAGTSTATSPVGVNRSLVGSSAGTSDATAGLTVNRLISLTGSSDGSSTATATESTAVALAGSSAGTSTVTGALSVGSANAFGGTGTGLSTATGAMGVVHTLISSATGTSTASGTLVKSIPLTAAASAGSSTATGTMGVTKSLAGSSDGASTAASSGSQVARALAGSSAGSTVVASAILTVNTIGGLSGIIAGTSTAIGTLSTALKLAGSSAGAGAASGSLDRTASLTGSSAGSSTAAATGLAKVVPLAGSSAGSSTATGTLRNTVALAGSADGASTAAGTTFQVVRGLQGASNGLSVASGTLQAIVILQIYGIWNGQVFTAMQYGDKPVVAFQMTTT